MTAVIKKLRCAVYTRKSHEEGLEQAFNSLDAQREAAVAYIASQKHEGWQLLPQLYDDGGYSGGTMERPALRLLLDDIKSGKVDVIVVYKVDRLSRSIHDFAQMMAQFDKCNVSFVSVTQQFNTTTSMGRLTLNILLSFAQFEREVTGERIRDKITASKKKGMWMGGVPPLGYRVLERHLVIEESEAILVRKIFEGYLACHSLLQLTEALHAEGHTTKKWQSVNERWCGGSRLTPKYLYRILTNAVYCGMVVHRKESYAGQHIAIIDDVLWQQVQGLITQQDKSTLHRWQSFFLLKGKFRTHEGFAMSPSSSHRRHSADQSGMKKQVHYYVSQKSVTQGHAQCVIKTLNARMMDHLVLTHVMHYLQQHFAEAALLLQSISEVDQKHYWLRHIIDSVVVGPEKMVITLDQSQVALMLDEPELQTLREASSKQLPDDSLQVWHQPSIKQDGHKVVLTLHICIKRVNGRRLMLAADGKDLVLPAQAKIDKSIAQAIGRAYRWRQMLDEQTDGSIAELAKTCGFDNRVISTHLSLTNLAPDIVQMALSGSLPATVTLGNVHKASAALSWDRQRQLLSLH